MFKFKIIVAGKSRCYHIIKTISWTSKAKDGPFAKVISTRLINCFSINFYPTLYHDWLAAHFWYVLVKGFRDVLSISNGSKQAKIDIIIR